MNAAEARKLTEQALTASDGVVGRMVNDALEKIVLRAKAGETSVQDPVTKSNSPKQNEAAYEQLKRLGFRVEYNSDPRGDDPYFDVSW